MSIKPEKVEIYEDGILKLELTDSDVGSLNGRSGKNGKYQGEATSVKIFGTVGAGVTFYDDKQFRTNENFVYIEKLTNEPVEVFISQNFVPRDEEVGSGVFFGENSGQYKWILFKNPKSRIDWDAILELILGATPVIASGRTISIDGIVGKIFEGTKKSNNYRVDNCSSVRFGDPPTT